MEDKDNQRGIGITTTKNAENDRELDLEKATSDVTLPSATRCRPSTSNTLSNHFSSVYNNSHHTQVRRSTDDREEDLLLESEEDRRSQDGSSETSDSPTCFGQISDEFSSLTSSCGQLDRDQVQSIAQTLENMSLQCTTTPQQESCGLPVDDSAQSKHLENVTFPRREDFIDNERFHGNLQSSDGHVSEKQLCIIVLFKRGIISREELIHALYVIPYEDFQKKFPKIKQYEALVCHGIEYPLGEENQTMDMCSLYRRVLINGFFRLRFEMVHGDNFSIVCPSTMTAHVSQVYSKSEDRIGGGFSITVLTRCTGGKDKLFQDSVRMIFQSGNTTLNLMFPIAYYEANVSPWLYDSQSVTAMPDEDREVLRSCHVKLLENIGDVISVCEHLYQHKILDCDDLEEIGSITKKRDRNAYFLRTIQTRGNILDLVIEIMRGKRENQEAAAILQRGRFQGTDRK